MTIRIKNSVGLKGVNERPDVRVIQTLLNAFAAWKKPVKPLKVDGLIGPKTIDTIVEFQKQAINMKAPDGRVDPNGSTIRYLSMYHGRIQKDELKTNAAKAKPVPKDIKVTPKKIAKAVGLNNHTVIYKSTLPKDRHLVSDYAKNVIKIALKESGMDKAVITSTYRKPSEQASIMLKNAKKNLKKQYQLYGSNGDKVLKVYDNNKDKKDKEIIELMVAEIESLQKKNKLVSKHCVSKEQYKKKNVIDIGLNSTKASSKSFDQEGFTKALRNLTKKGYIDKFIDETGKSNQCWHIEVTPNKKNLSEYNKGSILNQTKFVNEQIPATKSK